MRFIVFDKIAAEKMILQRELFSSEFENGLSLLQILKGSTVDNVMVRDVDFVKTDDGLYIIGKNEKNGKSSPYEIFVIDSEQSGIFSDSLSDQDNMQILQKMIRFSIRYWNKHGFPLSEKILAESSKAVLFPFSYSTSSNFKLVIERDADSKRTSKRGFGMNLLLYKANSDPAPSHIEQPLLVNFRIACENFAKINADAQIKFQNNFSHEQLATSKSAISVYTLGEIPNQSSPSNSFDYWMERLSIPQLKIIKAPLTRPVRIQGAAGTGKTLTLILKSIFELKRAKSEDKNFKSLFITHSNATKDAILYHMQTIGVNDLEFDGNKKQSIKVETLYSIFLDMLQNDVSSDDIIEADAYDAKIMQELYVSDCFEKLSKPIIKSGENKFSPSFYKFVNSSDVHMISSMLMHEFSVQLKGKSGGDFDKYKMLPRLSTGIPTENEYDKLFIYRIYFEYQKIFDSLGQFDADDIAISAYSKLNAPIWKRRRIVEGYDCIFVDETHLFNLNELQAIHFLVKDEKSIPITFAIDTAQAIGELACDADSLSECFCKISDIHNEKMQTVFRSTLEIANLSAAILSSGAQVFTNLTSLYGDSSFSANNFDASLDGKAPTYLLLDTDKLIIDRTIDIISEHLKYGIKASDICLIIFSESMKEELCNNLDTRKMKYTIINRRGDFLETKNAKENNKLIISFPEYVGGLEFDTVILLGVDDGRVPQRQTDISESFFRYTAINKLYISVSRARKNIFILGDKNRGISPCLDYAISNGFITTIKE